MLNKYFGRLDRWLRYSVRRRLLDRDLGMLREHMQGRVLEIGNGITGRRGFFQPPVAEVQQWIYLDLSAMRKPHVQADMQNLPLGADAFNTVVCLEVLEYVPDPRKALEEIHRVLKPGGTLLLSMPFFHRADAEQDFWRFTGHGLQHILKEAGFSVTCMYCQGYAFAAAVNIIKYAVYAQSSLWLRRLLGSLCYPVCQMFLALDAGAARRSPRLKTFTTGYLVQAHRAED